MKDSLPQDRMPSAKPFAGGLILFAGITIGLVWGITNGRAMQGVLFGTVASAAIAALLWLAQRR